MRTSSQIIEWFRDNGYQAQRRDYFGPFGIFVSKQPRQVESFTILDRAFFLVPDGRKWVMIVTPYGRDHHRTVFDDQEKALEAAIEYLEGEST